MTTLEEALGWRGETLRDAEGHRIGTIEEIYLDAATNEPEWALVQTGRLGTGRAFVPLRGARTTEDGPAVAFAKSVVEDAPEAVPDGELTKREEAELYRHYGIEPPTPTRDPEEAK